MTSNAYDAPPTVPQGVPEYRAGGVSRILGILLVLAVFVASAAWMSRIFAAKPVKAVRTWAEPVPSITLTPAEQAAAAAMPAHPGAVVVLTYHEVSSRSEADGAGTYTLATEAFARQMAALKHAGYRTVTTADVLAFVRGKRALPDRSVLLTFDDGHATDLGVADAILAQHGFRAASFVITGTVKPGGAATYHLNAEQIRTMAASGRWEIGSHTHASHYRRAAGPLPVATALDHRLTLPSGAQETMAQWRARVDADLAASQRFLTSVLGHPATAFAYPYGAYSSENSPPAEMEAIRTQLAALLTKNGFSMALAGAITAPEKANLVGEDPHRIRRLSVHRGVDALGLLKAMRSVVPSPVVTDPLTLRWSGKGSNCVVDRRTATLTVSSRRYGVAECRPFVNSSQWRDYTTTFRVRGVTDEAWPIVSVRDGAQWAQAGRIEVSVRRNYLYVKEIRAAGGRKLGGKLALGPPPPGGHLIGVRAVGREVSILINDKVALTRTTRTAAAGGITVTVVAPAGTALTFDRLAIAAWKPAAAREVTARSGAADSAGRGPAAPVFRSPSQPAPEPFVRLG